MKVKRITPAQQARIARVEQATGEIAKAHPGFQEVLWSFFGTDLIADVKDKPGDWHRYRCPTDDITAALGRGV